MENPLLNDYDRLEGQICQMKGAEVGVVCIGTFASAAIHWLPNIFARLQRDCPGIEYELLLGDYGEVERWIEEGRVDCFTTWEDFAIMARAWA